jgi:hypothetical protein
MPFRIDGTVSALTEIFVRLIASPSLSELVDVDSELDSLLSVTSSLLERQAPAADTDPESSIVSLCLALIDSIGEFLKSSPSTVVLQRLLAVQSGVLPWLHDADSVLDDSRYNDHVRSPRSFTFPLT